MERQKFLRKGLIIVAAIAVTAVATTTRVVSAPRLKTNPRVVTIAITSPALATTIWKPIRNL
jgi:hypothetical protein